MAIQKRNPAVCVILQIITCGFYGLYWIYKLSDELNQLEPASNSAIMDLLAYFFTCGIYLVFATYKWGKQINTIKRNYGMESGSDHSIHLVLFTVLSALGLGVISMCFIQTNINDILDRITAPVPPHASQF